MSANVWFEQVDTALLNEIIDTVKHLNSEGSIVGINADSVVVRKPEEEFKVEVFPCVSIYNSNYMFDTRRYNPYPVVVNRDEETKKVTMEDTAVPFNLSYQIDFWSKYQDDMNTMVMSWLATHFRQFNLPVVDDGGVARSCNCLMSQKPTKADLTSGGERMFHTIISYDIWVELDSETRYNKPMVIEREIGVEPIEEE